MKNSTSTPYSLTFQEVLNEVSKYALSLYAAEELKVRHSSLKSTAPTVDVSGITLAIEVKHLVLSGDFEVFLRSIPDDINRSEVVLGRGHNTSIGQSTVKIAYEFVSLALALERYSRMRIPEHIAASPKFKVYTSTRALAISCYDVGLRILDKLGANSLAGHFKGSEHHEKQAKESYNNLA